MNNIPVPYQVILERLNGVTLDGEIEVGEFRRLVCISFRVSNKIINKIMIEMKDLGLIEYKSNRLIIIKKVV